MTALPTNKRRRRLFWSVVVLVLIGLAIDALLALGIYGGQVQWALFKLGARSQYVNGLYWKSDPTAHPVKGDPGTVAIVAEALGQSCVELLPSTQTWKAARVGRDPDWMHVTTTELSIPAWTSRFRPAASYEAITAYGWPFKSWRTWRCSKDRVSQFEGTSLEDLPMESYRNTVAIVYRDGVPIWEHGGGPSPWIPGMVANALVYAMVLGLPIVALRTFRTARRRRKGCCTHCGYPLVGLHVGNVPCPECGQAV